MNFTEWLQQEFIPFYTMRSLGMSCGYICPIIKDYQHIIDRNSLNAIYPYRLRTHIRRDIQELPTLSRYFLLHDYPVERLTGRECRLLYLANLATKEGKLI